MMQNEVGTKDLARVLGLTDRRVQQLEKEAVFTKIKRGKFGLSESVQAYIEWKLKSEIDRGGDISVSDQVKIERARKLKLENDERENLLVDTASACIALDVILGPLLADLAGVPARVTDDVKERRKIENAIDEVLSNLSTRFEKAGSALEAGLDPDKALEEDNG